MAYWGRASGPDAARWQYRYQRLMLTPLFRVALRVVLPFMVAFSIASLWLSSEANRTQVMTWVNDLRDSVESRPEFTVQLMAVDGASPELSREIRKRLDLAFPVSSFDLDLPAMRDLILDLAPVRDVRLRVMPGGTLQVDVDERSPVMLWRDLSGLYLLDQEGVRVAQVTQRASFEGLPLVAGEGADTHVEEAMAIFAAAKPLGDRLRGLVRVGERRWDVVLDRGQRILLPQTGGVAALERVIALGEAQDMLARDLVAVDMRLPDRPTIRMNQAAVEEWWRLQEITFGKNKQ